MHYIYAFIYNAYMYIFKHVCASTHAHVCTDYIYVYVSKNIYFYINIMKRVLVLVEGLCPTSWAMSCLYGEGPGEMTNQNQ